MGKLNPNKMVIILNMNELNIPTKTNIISHILKIKIQLSVAYHRHIFSDPEKLKVK